MLLQRLKLDSETAVLFSPDTALDINFEFLYDFSLNKYRRDTRRARLFARVHVVPLIRSVNIPSS